MRTPSIERAPSFNRSHSYVPPGAVHAIAMSGRPPLQPAGSGCSPSRPPEAIVVSAQPSFSSRSVMGEYAVMGRTQARTQSRTQSRGAPPDRKPGARTSPALRADDNLGARLLQTPTGKNDVSFDNMSQPPDEVATPDRSGSAATPIFQQQAPPQQTPVRAKPSSVFWRPPPEAKVVCESARCLSFGNTTPRRTGAFRPEGQTPVRNERLQRGLHPTAPSTSRPPQATVVQASTSWQPPPISIGDVRPPSTHSFAPSPRYL